MLNNKGFSLVSAIVLSAMALIFISALAYFIGSGTRSVASIEMYKSSMEAAKGAGELIMRGIDTNKLHCSDDAVGFNSFLSDFKKNLKYYDINVDNVICKEFESENISGDIYMLSISAGRKDRDEKTRIKFGYLKKI